MPRLSPRLGCAGRKATDGESDEVRCTTMCVLPSFRVRRELRLGGSPLAAFVLHPLDPHPFAPRAGEEEDAEGEAEPQDAQADQKRRDADHRFHTEPSSPRPMMSIRWPRIRDRIDHPGRASMPDDQMRAHVRRRSAAVGDGGAAATTAVWADRVDGDVATLFVAVTATRSVEPTSASVGRSSRRSRPRPGSHPGGEQNTATLTAV